jgi:DNA invertase Pin-like site-specific DNA recombinase
MAKRVGIYLRVSTKNGQTVDNQRRALVEAIGRRPGWVIADEYADEGISGAKGRDRRPEFDRLLKDVVRRKIDVVAAWSVDRLGRSLQDLVGFLGELNGAGGDLYLEKQAIDTTTPSGRMLFQMLGVFAEFERALIQERIHAGLVRARQKGTRSGKPIGRPRILQRKVEQICSELAKGTGIRTARLVGVGVGTVQRIKASLAA